MLSKRWSLKPTAPPDLLRQYQGINPVLAQILYNRGFDTAQRAYAFLYVKADSDDDYNPLQLKGMGKAVTRIRQAIKRNEPIVVYGDFDADGVTSTTLLVQVFRSLGAKVKPYIPHRVDEGYGLNTRALQKLAQGGAKLIVTVDCGIRSVQQVRDGQVTGLDMIVTDHHSVGPDIEQLNEVAVAVVNPKQEEPDHPFRMLAGVGVAYKLADALIRVTKANGNRLQRQNLLDINTLLDLVAIGTVADLMPLSHLENRHLVTEGLKVLNRAERPGIRALLEVAGIKPGTMTASGIGFGLGPRINAAGRLESAMTAYHLLSATTKEDAKKFANRLQELNTKRQELTREAQETVRKHLEDEERDKDLPLIFAEDSEFQAGIVGLVAGRVAEEFFRPAIIMEKGKDESRASCRSIPQFDITNALDECADLLVRHGGHALAAGFTVKNENIEALKSRLLGIAQQQLKGQELVPTLDVDVEIQDINQLSEDLVTELAQLEPMGNDNPQPIFMTKNVRVLECRSVGKDDRHLKLRIARAGQPPLDAIGFSLGEWASHLPERIDMAYYLEINDWNGRQYLQMNLRDIRPSED